MNAPLMISLDEPSSGEQRVVIDGVDFDTYERLCECGESLRGRMDYCCGVLEIMSPSSRHEVYGRLLGRLVEAYTEEKDIEIISVASMTYKLREKKRGFEGDEAYYIQSANLVRHKEQIDAAVDPPPDLVIEIEITRSALRKLDICGPLGVPEVWRFHSGKIEIHVLRGKGYRKTKVSRVLPGFPFDRSLEIVRQCRSVGETKLIKQFRAGLRGVR